MTARDERAGRVFHALADATRREVVSRLAQAPATATELAGSLPVSRQAVAKHLQALDAAGLVARSRVGRAVQYELSPTVFDEAMAWMAETGTRWDERLRRLQARAVSPSGAPRSRRDR